MDDVDRAEINRQRDTAEIKAAMYESLRDYFINAGCPDDQAKRDADQMSEWLMDAVCDAIFPEGDDDE